MLLNIKLLSVYIILNFGLTNIFAQSFEKQIQYLSGIDNNHTVNWNFFCTDGRKSGYWTTIEVPSCWEQQGFGNYEYGRNNFTYGNKYRYASEQGRYNYNFQIPDSWKNKEIYIVFEGSMTDTEVKINGKSAGEKHQGAFYRFKYNITDKLEFGKPNKLEVNVSKLSTDESVNRAERYGDYWNFGGIFRPVFLEAYPKEHVSRIAIFAKADGDFNVDIFPKNLKATREIIAEITDLKGNVVGKCSSSTAPSDSLVTLKCKVNNPLLWTAETPNLYKVTVSLKSGKTELYRTYEKFGFRTIEIRHGDGIYLNNVKIKMKGINRHSFWPETGRTLNREICLKDAKLIKEMNMNAVRCSHYPPDQDFLDICDSLGLYVLDEIAGWQKAYDTPVGKKIVRETVIRDVNHPSVIFWDNGNEGGTNPALDKEFIVYDPSKRAVIHPHHKPGHDFNGIDCNHYEDYYSTSKILQDSLIYMPTEFLHCQDDGGGGASLYDFWELMWNSKRSGGGFLWALLDEGLVRTDQNGFIDTDGVNAPDGVLGPHREKEGSFFAIKQIYSPVHITINELPDTFKGVIPVENRYHFTNLNQCSFYYKLVNFRKPNDFQPGNIIGEEIKVKSPSIQPNQKGELNLNLPVGWQKYDAIVFSALDPFGNELYTWTWRISDNNKYIKNIVLSSNDKPAETSETDTSLTLKANGISVTLGKKDGLIKKLADESSELKLSFKNGPVLCSGTASVSRFKHFRDKDGYVAEITYTGDMKYARWKMYDSGWLSLEYEYSLSGEYQFAGISFNYPEANLTSVKWLGNGPYRVWKNRPWGVTYNVWEKAYNTTETAHYPWFYPEFKGYYSDITWLQLNTGEGRLLVVSAEKNLFVRLFQFYGLSGAKSYPELPIGDISFLDCIPPIGTKMATGVSPNAAKLGPEGELNKLNGSFKHILYFYFGIPDEK
ncbi:MAG TPA: glycoside hydrolase family 2 TIM barrel-domain containing protein [Bacteroidales bacterium]